VECYERLKGKNGGATVFQPLSTGITFALTEKAPGRQDPADHRRLWPQRKQDGGVFKWNFPLAGHLLGGRRRHHPAHRQEGRWLDKLKGKKIALVYHDSPFGKEPIPLLQERASHARFLCSCCP
jgi:branched-chain amino acid transport system substrate-binding protein